MPPDRTAASRHIPGTTPALYRTGMFREYGTRHGTRRRTTARTRGTGSTPGRETRPGRTSTGRMSRKTRTMASTHPTGRGTGTGTATETTAAMPIITGIPTGTATGIPGPITSKAAIPDPHAGTYHRLRIFL